MFTALLPLLVLAADLPPGAPTIDAAHASVTEGRLRVSITTSSPVDRADVHTKVRAQTFMVYVEGARITGDRTLATLPLPVAALARARYGKLEVTLARGTTCAGSVAITTAGNTIDVSAGCAPAGPSKDAVPVVKAAPAAKAPAAALVEPAKRALSVPESDPPAPRPPAPSPPAVALTPAPAATVVVMTPAPQPGRGPLAVAVALLVAAALGALVWRGRRAGATRQIRILETAALGPKRSLILAEINGATLVLGASEAGIALLTTNADPSSSPLEHKLGSVPAAPQADDDSDGQVGLLTRLFRREPAPLEGDDSRTGDAEEDEAFAAMLRESIEDQELRRRLAGGVSGRAA